MSVPAWLEAFVVAVGEDELRSALQTAVEAGDFCEHEQHRRALRAILSKPRVAFYDLPTAARRRVGDSGQSR